VKALQLALSRVREALAIRRRLAPRPERGGGGLRIQVPSVLWAVSAGVVLWSVLSPMSSARSLGWQLSAESAALAADRSSLAQVRVLRARLETMKAMQTPQPRTVSVTDLARVPLVLPEVMPKGVTVAEWSYSPSPGRQDRASLTLICSDFDSVILALGAVSSIEGVLVESVSVTPAAQGVRGRPVTGEIKGLRLLMRLTRDTTAGRDGYRTGRTADRPWPWQEGGRQVNAGPAERWRIVLGLVVLAAGGFLLLRGAAGSLLRALVPEAPNAPRSEVVAIPEEAGSRMRSQGRQEKEEEASSGGVVVSGEFRNDPFAPIPGQPGRRDVTAAREGEGRGQAGVPSSPAAQLPPPPPLQEVPGRVPAVERPSSEPVREEPQGASRPAPAYHRATARRAGRVRVVRLPSPSPAPQKLQGFG
jgi:hypothetical protein